MSEYDDYRIADDEQAEKINAELVGAKGEERAAAKAGVFPVYLTDEVARAAESCRNAASGCVYLLDYATAADEKRLLGYAADVMDGIAVSLGNGKTDREKFGAYGVRQALRKTYLAACDAAMRLCSLADASNDPAVAVHARNALSASIGTMAVYLMQI